MTRFREWVGTVRRRARRAFPPYARYRFARMGMYGSFLGMGVLCFLLDLPLLSFLGAAVVLNGLFLIVGSVVAASGYLREHPSIEVVGYPLLITAMCIFALACFIDPEPKPSSQLIGLTFSALAFGLYGRSRDIRSELKVYDRIAQETAVNGTT